jgi:hypothetical protein
MNPGWKMTQQSAAFVELAIVTSKTAIRIDNRKVGWSLIAKAPSWQITVFNPRARTVKTLSLPELRKQGLGLFEGEDNLFNCQSALGKKTGQYLGLKCTVLTLPDNDEYDFANGEVGFSKLAKPNISTALNSEYFLTDLGGCPAQVGQILSGIYRIPQTNSVPLGFRIKFRNGRILTKMRTTSINNATINSESFVLPVGYKVSKTLNYVIMPGTNVDHLTDWAALENLGEMGDLAAPRAQKSKAK